VDLRGRMRRRRTRARAPGRDREDAGMEREERGTGKGEPRTERINRERMTRTICHKTKRDKKRHIAKKKKAEDERTNKLYTSGIKAQPNKPAAFHPSATDILVLEPSSVSAPRHPHHYLFLRLFHPFVPNPVRL
jgi:hypothetical protein